MGVTQPNVKHDPNPAYVEGSDRPVEPVLWYDRVEFYARLTLGRSRTSLLPAQRGQNRYSERLRSS